MDLSRNSIFNIAIRDNVNPKAINLKIGKFGVRLRINNKSPF